MSEWNEDWRYHSVRSSHFERSEEHAGMARDKRYYVYIMASKSRVLYTGITGALYGRVMQHKRGELDGFTKRYNITRLVYFESFRYINNAIARETQIKKWRRAKKVALIESVNPTWEDLAADWASRCRACNRQTPRCTRNNK